MQAFLVAVHVVACLILVVTVLLQQGKGAEIGAVFGSSEAIFGSAGPATLLSKITTVCAIVFMVTSLSLTYISIKSRGSSVMRAVPQEIPQVPLGNSTLPGQSQKAPMVPQGEKGKNTSGVVPGHNVKEGAVQTRVTSKVNGQSVDAAKESVETKAATKAAEGEKANNNRPITQEHPGLDGKK